KKEVGFKDQNSSIHLLEAFTELYKVWQNDLLKERLTELLVLTRDKIADEKGFLKLFFTKDWNHISFKNSSKMERENNYGLDHVSFGHDYETAFLMLEASHALGIENDTMTLTKSKIMLDHAIENGWDNEHGGFFDEGSYFEGEEKCKIIKDTKTWWAQAEGLNALLLFSKIFPKSKTYSEHFITLWDYVKQYSLDHKNKGWYWGSIEKEPHMLSEPKGSIWKASYHDGRSLMNCIAILTNSEDNFIDSTGFKEKTNEVNIFINHWGKVSEQIK
ncbi:MAG: AGE family epimerase/isomerase, partial [Ignavibacteriae bacterium]|nr:AGE family epimerase/isomerase [Ignavibacteriota bacterium]